MKTMKWLLRREFWEHKGSLLIAPLIVAGIMLVMALGSLSNFTLSINGNETANLQRAMELYERMSPDKQAAAVGAIANLYVGLAAPIFLILAFTTTLFCVSALYDERRDRSILFWKSLPVSDSATVLSKAATALLVAPLLSLLIGGATALLLLLIFCVFGAVQGVNLFAIVFSTSDFVLAPFRMVAMLPVYMLWALPTVGWLLLVSAWARTKALAWAFGLPVLVGVLLVWAEKSMNFGWDSSWYWKNVAARGLLGLMPGIWMPFSDVRVSQMLDKTVGHPDLGGLVAVSWHSLAMPHVWIGAVVGAAMLYGAIRLRGAREEG